jgi:hypothetical protein
MDDTWTAFLSVTAVVLGGNFVPYQRRRSRTDQK